MHTTTHTDQSADEEIRGKCLRGKARETGEGNFSFLMASLGHSSVSRSD